MGFGKFLCPAALLALSALPAGADTFYILFDGGVTAPGQGNNSNVFYSSLAGLSANLNGGGTINPNSLPVGLAGGNLTLTQSPGVATMKASLASGTVGSSADSTGPNQGCGTGPGGVPCTSSNVDVSGDESQIYDTLTFHGSGTVAIDIHLDGNITYEAGLNTQNFQYTLTAGLGADVFRYFANQSLGDAGQFFVQNDTFTNGTATNQSLSGVDFTGQFSYTDGEQVPVFLDLSVNAFGGAVADFSHTAQISIDAQPGTYSSASGVFLTAAVPEPAFWPVAAAGLLGILVLRKRRPAQLS